MRSGDNSHIRLRGRVRMGIHHNHKGRMDTMARVDMGERTRDSIVGRSKTDGVIAGMIAMAGIK